MHALRRIHFITIAHSLPTFTENLFKTCGLNKPIVWHQALNSNIPMVRKKFDRIAREPNVISYDFGRNVGVAVAWNTMIDSAIAMGADCVVVLNDDLTTNFDDVLALGEYTLANPQYGVVMGYGYDRRHAQDRCHEFSIWSVTAENWLRVGYFDENFFPYFWEDVDWRYRNYLLHKMDSRESFAENVYMGRRYTHEGSASLYLTNSDAKRQHAITYGRNQQYYIQKWGGDRDHETYVQPFGDSRFGLVIAASERGNPYPEYQRTDHDIVWW